VSGTGLAATPVRGLTLTARGRRDSDLRVRANGFRDGDDRLRGGGSGLFVRDNGLWTEEELPNSFFTRRASDTLVLPLEATGWGGFLYVDKMLWIGYRKSATGRGGIVAPSAAPGLKRPGYFFRR
jgi:hypothetical protein